ncbi:MAG TPA: M18 family aminopeptidase [Dermatophilaceae bacterium]|nr:M18 family aminopeptidase [Dermatophilaceae bacterium]
MAHSFDTDSEATGLCTFIDASPSPFHACDEAGQRLAAAGFSLLAETDAFPTERGRYYLIRGGSLIAWSSEAAGDLHSPATPFRVVGAHTDSPNLRIKPQPDLARAGWQLLGIEIYGGPLFNSWLDRDLGLSGRVAVRGDNGVQTRLVTINEPVLRVAQLAVHLDRGANEGLALNPQQHLTPLWGISTEPGDFRGYLAAAVGVDATDVLSWDVMTHDLQPSRRIGRDLDLIAAPRLDNLATSYAGVRALIDVAEVMSGGGRSGATGISGAPSNPSIPVLVLFDHEEVGSQSERGAMSTLLPSVLERIVISAGGDRQDFHRALAGTVVASGDMAHATHPNYPEKHEPQHRIAINGGPVLKTNVKLRYATDSVGAAAFIMACGQAEVPVQQFVSRNDTPCGSTVGPMTAALVGATTVDFGAPMLSMHSARELCGAKDPAMYAGALAAFFNPQTQAACG